MKKLLLITGIIAALSAATYGQDYKTAIGLRLGWPSNGITVKHFLNETNALEGILATSHNGFVITGLFENEHWTGEYPGLNWYWGFGAHIGVWDSNPYLDDYDGNGVIGADFVLGLEYTFDDIPLNLSLDLMPSINLIGYTGWGGINSGLSVRYIF
jgi:hypothetical protein